MSQLDSAIYQAAQHLLNGKLVAMPTETVVGLAADAENPQALELIYKVKQRPIGHPLIVHVAPQAQLPYWAHSIPLVAYQLIERFWPGPLTLILKKTAHVPDIVSGGQDTVGLRCPSHPVAQQLLRAFSELKANGQGAVAAPSANRFGHVSPTNSQHVRQEFAAEIQSGLLQVLDGAAADIGIESTILDVSRIQEGEQARLLRPGHISRLQLAEVLGYEPLNPNQAAPRVSGSLKSHYAPQTPLHWLPQVETLLSRLDAEMPPNSRVAALVFDSAWQAVQHAGLSVIALESDPERFAQQLYGLLRALDQQGFHHLYIQKPPQTAAWEAVNDRLKRAVAAFASTPS
ncbi:L-threonylcarbamoyladenylate synthase [Brackiella oedipodis]|uniref:L-threonylcarbamoyladenylate synthase n=1 Tax=Brackiella oedipodis TaxID=124225 RepID=UPI00048D98A7|nr:L-threonylcarbamoyladenylate synthase [Brackiella oedipodis]